MQDRPYSNAKAITPHDTNTLAATTRAISVGGAGTVSVDMAGPGGGTNIQLTLPAGIHPLAVTKVYATGTAATGLVALW